MFEWGDLNFERDLKNFSYKTSETSLNEIRKVYSEKILSQNALTNGEEMNVGFHNALFNGHELKLDEHSKSVLVMGCGNSRLGEDILHYYLDDDAITNDSSMTVPKIIQCDISTHVVNSMTKRYHPYIEKDQMSVIQDDATKFTLIEDESIDAIVDKGLVDALFCADRSDMMVQIMDSVHRKLKLGRVFMFFSFSKPEYILKYTKEQPSDDGILIPDKKEIVQWKSVDVWELEQIYLYRFVKNEKRAFDESKPKLEIKRKLNRAMKKKMK